MVGSQEKSGKRQVRGPRHGSRSKGKGGKFDLSRGTICPQREADGQRFLLAAPHFLPTAHILFWKVAPG